MEISDVFGRAHADLWRVTEQIRELARRAYVQPLTKLLNRQALEIATELLVERKQDRATAVAFMDLTGFKDINEAPGLGYEAGDDALRRAADKWSRIAAMCSGNAFHKSGDEFVLLFPAEFAKEFCDAWTQERAAAFDFDFGERRVGVRADAGYALPEGDVPLNELQHRAADACKVAKESGSGPPMQWTPDVARAVPRTARWRCTRCTAVSDVKVTPRRVEKAEEQWSCPNCGEPRPSGQPTR